MATMFCSKNRRPNRTTRRTPAAWFFKSPKEKESSTISSARYGESAYMCYSPGVASVDSIRTTGTVDATANQRAQEVSQNADKAYAAIRIPKAQTHCSSIFFPHLPKTLCSRKGIWLRQALPKSSLLYRADPHRFERALDELSKGFGHLSVGLVSATFSETDFRNFQDLPPLGFLEMRSCVFAYGLGPLIKTSKPIHSRTNGQLLPLFCLPPPADVTQVVYKYFSNSNKYV